MTQSSSTPRRHSLTERRLAAKAMISASKVLKEEVPQQLQDFADGKTDDPGPL